LNVLIKTARDKWNPLAAWAGLRSLLQRGDPRRIFVGKLSRDNTRVIQTARSAPQRRQKVSRRKRVLVARKKKVATAGVVVARFVLFGAAVSFLAVDVHGYMFSSPRFVITHIAVDGNVHVTARRIIAESGIAEGRNIFRVGLAESASAIRRIPWVLDARVRRRLPDEIHIEVIERRPVALVLSREIYFMDPTGKVVAGFDAAEGLDVPFITARDLGPLKPGDTVRTNGIADALEIVRLMDTAGVADEIPISEINIDDPANIVLIARQSGASIFFGSGDMDGKLWRLAKIAGAINQSERLDMADLEKVDLRFGAIVPVKIRGG